MDWFLIISASLCGIASVVALFMSLRWCAVPAFVSMLLASLLWTLDIPMLLFWGAATAMIWAIGAMLPPAVASDRRSGAYTSVGTITGALLGHLASVSSIPAMMLGAFLGFLAYSRTPGDKSLPPFPAKGFWQYLCAKGLPPVVTIAMTANAIYMIILYFRTV